ncbi:MAG: tail fiber domain-containing protein [Desulfomicrobium escambiense]|nr:tail fiber domain-containing protein [Desulfomicrobium escambiense]
MKRLNGFFTDYRVMAALILMIGICMAAPLTVYGADRLMVKDGNGNTKFVVTDAGMVGVGLAAARIQGRLLRRGGHHRTRHVWTRHVTAPFLPAGGDTGGWLTSASDNNFFVSSGAMWNGAGWMQKSPDGKAVIAGSGGSGYRVITRQGCAVGAICTPTTRLTIDYTGKLTLGGGAYSDGASWFDASSREYKDNIRELSAAEAGKALEELNPVTFSYKTNPGEQHVGFIAEDVPALVATGDRKGLSAMDIVAVLTKVVKEQKEMIEAQTKEIQDLRRTMKEIAHRLGELEMPSKADRLQIEGSQARYRGMGS